MVKIVNKQVSALPRIPWATGKATAIILHETANDSDNGRWTGEVNYMRNNWRNAFVHFFTGEQDTAMTHDPAKGGAWGAGPAMHAYGIHFELCRSSTKAGFLKAYNNWLDVMVHYAKKYGIPMVFNSGKTKRGFFTHDYVRRTWGGTTHTDPNAYLAKWGVSIAQLEKDLKKKYNEYGKSAKGELTVSQYNELKALIEKQDKQIKAQEKEIAALKKTKQTIPNANASVDPAHADNWKWAQKQGLLDGKNPLGHVTREQLASVMRNFYDRFIANPAKAEEYAEEAFEWAAEHKISDASNPAHLSSRQQVITIVYRAFELAMNDVQQMIEEAQKKETEEINKMRSRGIQ